MQTETRSRFYLPELDGLRFIAFMLVFVHNSPYLEHITIWKKLSEFGWIGVDLFFCLSAFLITRLLVAEQKVETHINIRNFYVRRALRILPLYISYLGIALIFSLGLQELKNIHLHLLGLFTFTFNIAYLFLTPHLMVFFIHLWTISYEEQFYAIIPWFLRATANIRIQVMWATILFLFVLFTLIRALFIFGQVDHPAIYMLPITHFESVLLGVALGLGLFDRPYGFITGWNLFLLAILCITSVFFLPNNYEITWALMLTYPLVALGMFFLIYSVTKLDIPYVSLLLRQKLLVYLGKISYGLYMFHLISNFLAAWIYEDMVRTQLSQLLYRNLFVFIGGLALTIITASLSYSILERPFLKLKHNFTKIPSHPT